MPKTGALHPQELDASRPLGEVSQFDYDGLGTGDEHRMFSRALTYNSKSQIATDITNTKTGATTYRAETTYAYGSGAGYKMGAAVSISTANFENDAAKKTTLTINSYEWWDSAVQSGMSFDADSGDPNNTLNQSDYTYANVGGQAVLTKVHIVDGRTRDVAFTNDLSGQVIQRQETDNQSGGDPYEFFYRFAGRQRGYVGNNGTLDTDYVTSIEEGRTVTQGTGAFRYGQDNSTAYADFDQSVQPITSYYQGSAAGFYTVRGGDTLSSIAAALWGDALLWYQLAEINGLSAASALTEGQILSVPTGVMKSTHNASTFTPYDPTEITGATSPTAPKPGKKGNSCGGLGQIIMVIIAVVVTVYTAGAASAGFASVFSGGTFGAGVAAGSVAATGITGAAAVAGSIVGGAAAGAAGSIVSQAVGVATGIQDKFSWNAVALAAIGGGVGAGLSGSKALTEMLKHAGGGAVQAGLRGAIGNTLTQGVAVATGLQDKFSWAGIAAAGVGAGVFNFAARTLPGAATAKTGATLGNQIGASGAQLIADATARSLIEGSDFGDNILAALPNVVGQTIGESIAGRLAGAGGTTAAEKQKLAAIQKQKIIRAQSGTKAEQQALMAAGSQDAVYRPGEDDAEFMLAQQRRGGAIDGDEGVILDPEGEDADRFGRLNRDSPELMFPEEPLPRTPEERAALEARVADRAARLAEEDRWYNQLGRWGAGAAGELGSWALETGVPEFGVGIGLVDGFLDLLKFRGGAAAARVEARAAAELAEELFERTAGRIAEDGHAFLRHGEAVTDTDLIRRATTGVAPDGSWVADRVGRAVIPRLSSAFNSDRMLVAAELHLRHTYLPRAAALASRETTITIKGVEMGQVVGRGYTRASAGAAPTVVNDLSRVTATFRWDFSSATWRTVTIYPSR